MLNAVTGISKYREVVSATNAQFHEVLLHVVKQFANPHGILLLLVFFSRNDVLRLMTSFPLIWNCCGVKEDTVE